MATIDNKITFEEFRKRCEDKSTITTKGQLYVGTSNHDTVNGKQITRTVATPEPVEYALLVRDDTQAGGLNWKSVAEVLSAAANDGHQSTSVESAHYAKTAGVASNVESQINGHDISVIFETDGTTVKEATEAANVSQTINGQNISSIFESNGTTVKNATNAVNTDFTNSEWKRSVSDSTGTVFSAPVVNGATYEVIPYYTSNSGSIGDTKGCAIITYDTFFPSQKVVVDSSIYDITSSDGIFHQTTTIEIKQGIMKAHHLLIKMTLKDGRFTKEVQMDDYYQFRYRRIR